jgi:putative addiction module component (TIGR02574 family)
MRSLDTLLQEVLALPLPDKTVVIRRLVESLDDAKAEPGTEDAWAEVVARRIEDLDAGRTKLIDGKSAIKKARAELRRRRRG